jgi:hypothetical protein
MAPVQTYARITGALLLITLVAGGFGELFVPSRLIVSADAARTASNIIASDSLFRLGFAGYLLEAFCDITLTLLLYLLLRPVREDVALLATLFRVVSTATFAVTELFYFAASLPLRGAEYLKTFSPDQLNTLALLSLKAYGLGGGIFMAFYGVASMLLGYLMIQSGYLPRILGALLALSGLAFVVYNFALVLAPRYAWSGLLAPAGVAVVSLGLWLIVRGVDVAKWDEQAALARSLRR